MLMAIVQGNATATVGDPTLKNQRLLICQELDRLFKPVGDPLLVIDHLGAKAGDVVMLSSDSGGVSAMVKSRLSPIRWFVLGLIDPRRIGTGETQPALSSV